MGKKNFGNKTEKIKRILSDHQRVGKRFIPPFLQKVSNLEEVVWLDYILPELLWLGLLNEFYDYKTGAALALSLAKAAATVNDQPNKIWFASTSSYSILKKNQRNKIITFLRSSNELELLQKALFPLGAFYPKCPLDFLFGDRLPRTKKPREILGKFKLLLSRMFDRTGIPSTRIQANAVYIAFCTEMLVLDSKTSLANFPAVADYPETEESIRIAASVRATTTAFFGFEQNKKSSPWSTYFWNRGLELESCDYE
ncbi:MAG TPA: hypothetical protein VNN20_06360 [Thermodesulfobacteriota bacterium]|nr:hypothetical protein [Thermodesulfobacteriota bacterium]